MGGRNQTIQRKIVPLVVQFSSTAKGLAFRNLQDMLVHSKLGLTNKSNNIKTQDTMVRGDGQECIKLLRPFLSIGKIVYLIKCSLCRKRYVEETGNSILTRMWGHKSRYFDEIQKVFFILH